MSKLNINRNIFLDREELLRFQKFLLESPINSVILKNTTNFGIIDSSGGGESVDFLLEKGTNSGTIKISNHSIAIDEDGLLISQPAIDNIPVVEDGNWYWYYIEHQYSNLEKGELSINSDGQVTGTGTEFSKVIRGQSTEVPTKVKLISDNNTGVYDVVDYDGDFNMILEGESFTPESGIKYYIVGSIALSETVTEDHMQGLYQYDSCNIVGVKGFPDNGPSPLSLNYGKQFFLGIAINTGTDVVIIDGRQDSFWKFYIHDLKYKLDSDPNNWDFDSSDLDTIRGVLDVYDKEEINDMFLQVDNFITSSQVSWKSMYKGANIGSDGFDIKICRIGRSCTITGKFVSSTLLVEGDIIASIPISALKESEDDSIILTNRIYQTLNAMDTSDANRGTVIFVESLSGESSDIQIKTLRNRDTTSLAFTLTFNLI